MSIRIRSNDGRSVETRNHSCSYSGLSECFDEDMEEVLNANHDSIRDELTAYGYEPDQLVRDLLIDLDPKVDRFPNKNYQDEHPRINYLTAAFSVIQESVVIHLLNNASNDPLWKRKSFLGGAFACFFALVGVVSVLGMLSDYEKTDSNTFIANNEITDPYVKYYQYNKVSVTSGGDNLNSEDYAENSTEFSQEETIDLLNKLDGLSEEKIKYVNRITYAHLKNGVKFEPTEENIIFLKKITEINPNEPSFVKAAFIKNDVLCSNDGFYSHIVRDGETLISISDKCGFGHKKLNTAKSVPILSATDVIHFSVDNHNNLTKVTVYQDDDFHILDFDKGRFLEKDLLGEEKSIIVEVDFSENQSISKGLENSEKLKNKGSLWEKVVANLVSDYSNKLIMTKIPENKIYYVNIKYRHNSIKDYYEVIGTSIDDYDS